MRLLADARGRQWTGERFDGRGGQQRPVASTSNQPTRLRHSPKRRSNRGRTPTIVTLVFTCVVCCVSRLSRGRASSVPSGGRSRLREPPTLTSRVSFACSVAFSVGIRASVTEPPESHPNGRYSRRGSSVRLSAPILRAPSLVYCRFEKLASVRKVSCITSWCCPSCFATSCCTT